jgi:hypothetical protein
MRSSVSPSEPNLIGWRIVAEALGLLAALISMLLMLALALGRLWAA